MANKENEINVSVPHSTVGLNISTSNTKQVIDATNNRAQYYADLAKKYRDEAKQHRDNAKYYSEQNSDVTFEYIDSVKAELIRKIETQVTQLSEDFGDELDSRLPQNVSELNNDVPYIPLEDFENIVKELELPPQTNCEGMFLSTDGENEVWKQLPCGISMFDTILKDHILTYEESKGLALQGTYVYKEVIAGSRYGYPDFYAKCLEEYNEATTTETVNGVTVKVNSNGHKFYNISNKTAIDDFYNAMGTAWFYGVDTENERIFLPRNNYFDQLTGNITEVGQLVEAGLPNIEAIAENNLAAASTYPFSASGAFANSTSSVFLSTTGSGSSRVLGINNLDFDASLANPIYGNSNTVQPPAVKKLLYICVGNTEVTSTVTDVVDVTTTENDTTPLFTGMYFDFTPNNPSWLIAGGQANSGGIYTTCYNELVNVLNGETKYGDLKVVDTANMVDGTDYSLYWKVDQTAMIFTCPTVISSKSYNDIAPVVGNGMALGMTNGENDFVLYQSTSVGTTTGLNGYGSAFGSQSGGSIGGAGLSYGVTTDSTKSGIEAHLIENTNAQLYFKVANAVQNLELLDVGEVLEAVNTVVSNNSNLISGYSCPDWDNVITVTSNANTAGTYVAPSNGILITDFTLYGGVGYVIINGVDITRRTSTTNYMTTMQFSMQVSKGDVVEYYTAYPTANVFNSNAVKFVPMKGVN